MTITIVLCTYNRCESLAVALSSVVALTLPESIEWDVLVIDNNSTDKTRSIVEAFCKRYPNRIRYLFEPRPGKSHALNAGIREARGDILAFTDDDVTVEPNWLQNLTSALNKGAWAGAGGRVLPAWTCPRPRWLPAERSYAMAPLALFDAGHEPGELREPPFGVNMAFHRSVFKKYGCFRADLGPQPGNEIRNEDTEFGSRVLAGGEHLRYEPLAIVFHPVSRNRLRKQYFLAWWFGKGRADIRQGGIWPQTHYQCLGVPLAFFRNLAAGIVRWMVATEPSERFCLKLKVWTKAGEIFEAYRQSRRITATPRGGVRPAATGRH